MVIRPEDIKKKYKNNIFRVGLELENGENFLNLISDKFDITESTYDIRKKQLDFTVQLPSDDTRSFLSILSAEASINNFVETIPTANEIFIQTVPNINAHE